MNLKIRNWLKNSALMRPLEKKVGFYLGLVYLIFFILFFRFAISSPAEKRGLLLSEITLLQEERGRLQQNALVPVSAGTAPPVATSQKSFENLSALLSRSGLKLIESRFSPMEQEGPLSKQTVQLSLAGPFLSFGPFLEALESQNPPLVVDEISIIVNETKISHVSVDLKGSLYGSGDR